MIRPLPVIGIVSLLLGSTAAPAADPVQFTFPDASATVMSGRNTLTIEDNRAVLIGNAEMADGRHGFLARFAADGSVDDALLLSGDGTEQMVLSRPTADGGRIVGLRNGADGPYGRPTQALLIRLDADDAEQWRTTLGSVEKLPEWLVDVQVSSADDAIFVTTFRRPPPGGDNDQNAVVYRLSSAGIVQWSTELRRAGIEFPQALFRPAESDVLMLKGYSFENVWLEPEFTVECRVSGLDVVSGAVLWERRPQIGGQDFYCFGTRMSGDRLSVVLESTPEVSFAEFEIDPEGNLWPGAVLQPPVPSSGVIRATMTPAGELLLLMSAVQDGQDYSSTLLGVIDAERESVRWHWPPTLAIGSRVRDLQLASNGRLIAIAIATERWGQKLLHLGMFSMTGRSLYADFWPGLSNRRPEVLMGIAFADDRIVLARDVDWPSRIELITTPLPAFADGFE
jgi:hypothetical protein